MKTTWCDILNCLEKIILYHCLPQTEWIHEIDANIIKRLFGKQHILKNVTAHFSQGLEIFRKLAILDSKHLRTPIT